MMKIKIFVLIFLLIGVANVFAQSESATLSSALDEGVISTLKFKDADIRVVLQAIAQKAVRNGKKVNIIISPEVKGLVSLNLEKIYWETALEVILKTYGYGVAKYKDVIIVALIEEIKAREAQERERQEVEPPQLKVHKLKYIDANDAKLAISPLLSPSGRVSVLEMTGQAGWEFGTDVTKRSRVSEGRISRTKVLVVSDITQKLDEIDMLLKEIDTMPKQVLIKTRILEVARDYLEDIGFDWGTGSSGATSASYTGLTDSANKQGSAGLSTDITPSLFAPLEGTSALTPSNTGLRLAFKKLTGAQFEAVLHTLYEDANTNTLSAPSILTLNNQEASILVGEKYPIVKTETSEETNNITGGSLDYYQDIGIQVNVVPQICGDKDQFISMIIHPAVTTRKQDVSITSTQGANTVTLASYPWLKSRETETQVIVRDGNTIVIGGLLKDVKSTEELGVPLLKDLPFIGKLFKRTTEDIEKIDLLIFITAKIVGPEEDIPNEILNQTPLLSKFEKVEKQRGLTEKNKKRKKRKKYVEE